MNHEKVYGICENKCREEIYRKSEVNENFCEKNHASQSNEFGLANENMYGHVKISSSFTNSAGQAIALSQSAGYQLAQRFNRYYTKTQIDNKIPNDTGWITLPLASGVTASESGRGLPQYRKIGNHVYVRGTIDVTTLEDSSVLVATLPSGYRPSRVDFNLQTCYGPRIAQIFVNAYGELKVDKVYNLTDGSIYAGNLWVQVVIDYYVD